MKKLKKFVKKLVRFIKRRGLRGVMEKIKLVTPKIEVLKHLEFIMDREEIPFRKAEFETHKNDDIILLNWIIPEMGIGSGGHINIFRFISNLEKMDFHSRVYLYLSPNYKDNESVRKFTKEHFSILDSNVELFYDVSEISFAHATIATSWQTAYYVRNYNNTISKCYFVQDFEPYFYPMGSYYEFAENTYKFGLKGITAGDWLKDKLREEYGMDTESFGFSYDKDLYIPKEKHDSIKRIFFYARPYTARRDFELGLLALEEVSKRVKGLEVVFAGEDVSKYVIPFKHRKLRIVTIEKLSSIYSQSDLCIIISNTNLSLLPLEVMASNSVVVCSKGENSTWLVNSDNAILVNYDPVDIANTMEYYLNHPEELEVIRKKGLEFAYSTSWVEEAEKVRDALIKWIEQDKKRLL